jgi:DsbC/DsbD-like thiol-disulfide interchange protein
MIGALRYTLSVMAMKISKHSLLFGIVTAAALAAVSFAPMAAEAVAAGNAVAVKSGDVEATIALSGASAAPGHRLAVTVDFKVAPGWHIYGTKVSENYIPTSIGFDSDVVASQSWNFPPATPVNFKLLGETLPVYQGHFRASGTVMLKNGLKPGEYRLAGTLKFQECNDSICKVPRAAKFELPLRIEPGAAGRKT